MQNSDAGSVCSSDGRSLPAVSSTEISQIETIIETSRAAQRDWSRLTLKQRAKRVQQVARRVLDNREEILDIIGDEMGRGRADSLLSELTVMLK